MITKTLEGAPKGATHWSTLCVLALVGLIGIAPLHAYNLARVHRTLKTTPAMAAGVADHKPTLGEIAALLD